VHSDAPVEEFTIILKASNQKISTIPHAIIMRGTDAAGVVVEVTEPGGDVMYASRS